MLSHSFSHDGTAYEVSFRRMDRQWLAALRRAGEADRPLPTFTEEKVGPLSDQAIRAGYISLAEWLARNGSWSEPAAPAPSPPVEERAPVVRTKAAPCIAREAQELIGREMQAMYADVLKAPLPDNLVALLGAALSA